jgi:glutamate carboxypeptidase
MTSILIPTLALALLQPKADGLTAEERALTAFIDKDNANALVLLEKVVNLNSGTMNFAGVRAVGAALRPEFDALGFKTEWVDGASFERAGHLVADHPGTGPRILLIGHIDTVFEPESPFQKFERIDADTAKGPGITDMKGGDVVMIQALKALNSIGALKTMNIVVVLTGDEEAGGRPLAASRAALVKAAQGAAYAIGFEDGASNPKTAVIGRRGTTGWELRVKGKPAHSSQIFNAENGYGAIFETARILNSFREKLAGQPHLTFNPGVIIGGTSVDFDGPASKGIGFGKSNVIAEHTVVTGDVRALSREQFEAAKKAMQEITAASLPRTSATLTFEEGYPPLAPTPGNERLLALYSKASVDVGTGEVVAVDPDKAGAADVSFVSAHVGMILDGVGLMGSGGHTVLETADLRTLPSMAKRAAVLLSRLRAERRP